MLGGIGAAQELGSVLGPLYGIAVVWALNTWRDVFWINVPLAAIAMVMIHFSLPSKLKSEHPEKVDVVGGVLLAIALGPGHLGPVQPRAGRQAGAAELRRCRCWSGRWSRPSRSSSGSDSRSTRLIEPAGVHFRPFLAALGASLAAGAALMVTLVNVELFGQGVLGHGPEPGRRPAGAVSDRPARSARCWAAGSQPRSAIGSWRSPGC